jgi:Domain of unknown function (DUF4783)
MKKWLIGAMLLIAGLAQAQADIAAKVNDAIKNSDAIALTKLMQNQVEISIADFEGALSKEEAQKKLTQFFVNHKVNAYSPKHNGTSKMGDQYYIGEMKSGATLYRVTVFVKKTKDGTRVSQLRIEES